MSQTVHQFSRPDGDGYNVVTQEFTQHFHYGGTKVAEPPETTSTLSPGQAAAGGGGFIGLVVLVAVGYLVFGNSEPFPTTTDPWPAGYRPELVLTRVAEWMQTCTKSTVAQPANCPQALDQREGAPKVEWTLYGNPVDDTRIKFNAADDRFDVLGTAVMVGRYRVSNAAAASLQPMHYWAKVAWHNGHPAVKEIEAYDGDGDPPIVKRDPRLPWDTVAGVVDRAFDQCIETTTAPMPAGCPVQSISARNAKVKWTIDGEPLLTARPSFDPTYGLIHVKGSYAVTASYRDGNGPRSITHSGTYDAVVAAVDGTPTVLQIKDFE